MATFQDKLMGGPVGRGYGASGRDAVGGVVLHRSYSFDYTDTGAFSTGIVLPAGSRILSMDVDFTAAWNSASSDALEVGDGTDPDEFGDIADIQTTGKTAVTVDAAQAAVLTLSADTTLYLKINSAGGSLSAGAGVFNVLYTRGV